MLINKRHGNNVRAAANFSGWRYPTNSPLVRSPFSIVKS